MKEATGELNMTVVVIIAIAAIAGLFYAFIWPAISGSLKGSTRCASAVNCGACNNGQMVCHYYEDNGSISNSTVTCDCDPNS